MRIERNLRLIDAYTLGTNMIFVLPVLVPYYHDRIGVDFHAFMAGEAAFAAAAVLCDVPAGWLADMWQRRHVEALGIFTELAGFAILLFARSFAAAVAAQTVIGIGISLCTGTNTAILYDSLLSAGRQREYRRREGRRQAMGFYTMALSGVAGGFLYPLDHRLPLVLTIAAFAVAGVATLMLDEPLRRKQPRARHPLKDIFITVKYALHDHAEIGFAILSAGALFAATKIVMWTQQPYFMLMHVPESWYGVLMAVGFLLGGAASHASHLIDGKIGAPRALALIWAAAIAICLGAAWHPGWHGVVLLMLGGTCIFGLASPRVNEVINNHVDSGRRATVLSTQSLTVRTVFIPLSMAMGSVSKHWGFPATLVGLALWLGVTGSLLGLLALRRRRTPAAEMQY
ncbi:MAG: MFS transporter [Alphaproteobacteria bacterium]|nr:MFS transporter [Alphaproteobacteria bacterium]